MFLPASVGKSVRNETGTGMKSKKKKEFNTSNLKKNMKLNYNNAQSLSRETALGRS